MEIKRTEVIALLECRVQTKPDRRTASPNLVMSVFRKKRCLKPIWGISSENLNEQGKRFRADYTQLSILKAVVTLSLAHVSTTPA
jgi:hypothetical protein